MLNYQNIIIFSTEICLFKLLRLLSGYEQFLGSSLVGPTRYSQLPGIENGPFIDGLPIKQMLFSIAMLNSQRIPLQIWLVVS